MRVVRPLRLAATLSAGMLSAATACTYSTPAPTGSGDDQHVDVDATTQPPQPTEGGPDSPFAPVDAGYPSAPDGYDPVAACKQCACPKGTYCFGGGTGYTSFSGDCHADAGPDAGFAVGCQPVPAACRADASCVCLIEALPALGCYPVCAQNDLTVYCPHP